MYVLSAKGNRERVFLEINPRITLSPTYKTPNLNILFMDKMTHPGLILWKHTQANLTW